jgi:hypothetical protein
MILVSTWFTGDFIFYAILTAAAVFGAGFALSDRGEGWKLGAKFVVLLLVMGVLLPVATLLFGSTGALL